MSDAAKKFVWTPEVEDCLERILAGWPKKQIAEDIGVHRNTITNWCNQPEFEERLKQAQADIVDTTRQRRMREVTRFNDRIAKLATDALTKLEKTPESAAAFVQVRSYLSEWRALRAEERSDAGDNIQHHKMMVEGKLDHKVTVGVQIGSFKGFLADAYKTNAIDVNAIDDTADPTELITRLTQQALLNTDMLDTLAEEDANAKFDPTLPASERKR